MVMKRRDNYQLTPKEEELMQLLWEHEPILISKLIEFYPEPKPHFNTISTVMKRLEAKGFVSHNEIGGSFQFFSTVKKEKFRNKSFGDFIKNYFGGSYYGVVSALVEAEKISAKELQELLELIEKKGKQNG